MRGKWLPFMEYLLRPHADCSPCASSSLLRWALLSSLVYGGGDRGFEGPNIFHGHLPRGAELGYEPKQHGSRAHAPNCYLPCTSEDSDTEKPSAVPRVTQWANSRAATRNEVSSSPLCSPLPVALILPGTTGITCPPLNSQAVSVA